MSFFDVLQLNIILHGFHKNCRVGRFCNLARNVLVKCVVHLHRIDEGSLGSIQFLNVFVNVIVRMKCNIYFLELFQNTVI